MPVFGFRQMAALLVVNNARQIFDCQRSDFFTAALLLKEARLTAEEIENHHTSFGTALMDDHLRFLRGFHCVPHRIVMVGLGRFELPTSPLSGVRSNQLSYRPRFQPNNAGGAGRDRTGGLLNANQALSQLSYSPLTTCSSLRRILRG
jgi:hypothetical protein